MNKREQQIIENHVNKHNGGWYNIIDRYTDCIRIKWGKGDRSYIKLLQI